jgi:3-oxoacyl-[acyl-carrier protein] reductase
MTHDGAGQGKGGAKAGRKGANDGADRLDELRVGMSESIEKTIRAEDVEAFARLSGDYNELHVDDEFAARTEFSQRVVHGFLHASLLSTLVGMKIPGRGALYLSQNIEFTAPVFIGDTVKATATITRIDKITRIIAMDMRIENQKGAEVLRGEARAKVLRLAQSPTPLDKGDFAAMSQMLEGKTALITGASRGIGRAIAALLAAHGARVFINYHRSQKAALELVGEIEEAGGKAEAIRADVTRQEEIEEMIARACQTGGLDILVNNAGPKILSSSFDRLEWSDMDEAYGAIVGSTFRVIQAALPHLRESEGNIVNLLTSAALGRTAHNWLPYVAAKSALIGLSKNLAQELGPDGIRVNMVSPSMVDTDLTADIPERIRQMMVSRTPLRRLATTENVANAVLFLVSPMADFITGDNLLVTGGEIML